MPDRQTLLIVAVVCFVLAVVLELLGVEIRLNLVALGLALATYAQLR
jgi:hypothetical protein